MVTGLTIFWSGSESEKAATDCVLPPLAGEPCPPGVRGFFPSNPQRGKPPVFDLPGLYSSRISDHRTANRTRAQGILVPGGAKAGGRRESFFVREGYFPFSRDLNFPAPEEFFEKDPIQIGPFSDAIQPDFPCQVQRPGIPGCKNTGNAPVSHLKESPAYEGTRISVYPQGTVCRVRIGLFGKDLFPRQIQVPVKVGNVKGADEYPADMDDPVSAPA